MAATTTETQQKFDYQKNFDLGKTLFANKAFEESYDQFKLCYDKTTSRHKQSECILQGAKCLKELGKLSDALKAVIYGLELYKLYVLRNQANKGELENLKKEIETILSKKDQYIEELEKKITELSRRMSDTDVSSLLLSKTLQINDLNEEISALKQENKNLKIQLEESQNSRHNKETNSPKSSGRSRSKSGLLSRVTSGKLPSLKH